MTHALPPVAIALFVSLNAVLLTGCSGEPSGSDIRKAVQTNAVQGAANMEQMSRGSSRNFMPQVHEVRKLGCKQENQAAWLCDVELDMTSPQGVRGRTPVSLRFVSGSDGWSVSR